MKERFAVMALVALFPFSGCIGLERLEIIEIWFPERFPRGGELTVGWTVKDAHELDASHSSLHFGVGRDALDRHLTGNQTGEGPWEPDPHDGSLGKVGLHWWVNLPGLVNESSQFYQVHMIIEGVEVRSRLVEADVVPREDLY